MNSENKLKEYADKHHSNNIDKANLIAENEEMKRKTEEIPILEDKLYRKNKQEANNKIIVDDLNTEINKLKRENETLRNQVDENVKISKSLRSSVNPSYREMLITTTNSIDPAHKNGLVSEVSKINNQDKK